MKNVFLAVLFSLTVSFPVLAQDVWVDGYTRSNGTYVPGHYRSRPNAYQWDNKSYTPNQPKYNNSYNSPTRDYNSNWYVPSETRFQDSNPHNNSPYQDYTNQNYFDGSFDSLKSIYSE